ncbi:MAG TPA: hypothetical protein VF458_19520 [Ktedonobacteraceae bacterium]
MKKLNLQRTLLVIVVVAFLLATLVGGILRIEAAGRAPVAPHNSHPLAWFCSGPPVAC